MYPIILVIHIVLSLAIIGLVLVQRGKGAEMGAGFGGGGSQSVFGSSGAGSFLTRSTAWLATAFFVSCLTLSYLAVHRVQDQVGDYLPTLPEATPISEPQSMSDLPAVPVVSHDSSPPETTANTSTKK